MYKITDAEGRSKSHILDVTNVIVCIYPYFVFQKQCFRTCANRISILHNYRLPIRQTQQLRITIISYWMMFSGMIGIWTTPSAGKLAGTIYRRTLPSNKLTGGTVT